MSHTETKEVTYLNAHRVKVDGRVYALERTCRIIPDGHDDPSCSACGAHYMCMSDASFCPDCGAKVVKGMTMWTWRFPPIAKPHTRLSRQLAHVMIDVNEAYDAFEDGESTECVAEELMNVIHAAETALRMLDVDADEVWRGVIEKNRGRGYYGSDGE